MFRFLTYPHSSYFCVLVLIYIMVNDIGHLYKCNRPKQSTTTFKKPTLSSSAAHKSSESNLTLTSISSQPDNKDITTNQNNNNNLNTYDIHSCAIPWKQYYSVQATYTSTCLTPLNTTRPIAPVELHKNKNYPRLINHICVSRLKKISSHVSQCIKSRITNKAIDYILYIDTFEQQCAVIKVVLQSSRLEDHMKTIGIDQSLCNRFFFWTQMFE